MSDNKSKYIIEKAPDAMVSNLSFALDKFENCFIAGGALKDFYLKRNRKDVDLFSYSEEEMMKEIEKAKADTKSCDLEYSSDNSAGFTVHYRPEGSNFVVPALVDLVKTQYGSPEQIISRFDMTVAQAALFKKDDEFFVIKHPDYDAHITAKKIVFENYHGNVAERIARYIGYGFAIDDYEAQKAFAHFAKAHPEFKHLFNKDGIMSVSDMMDYSKSFKDAVKTVVDGNIVEFNSTDDNLFTAQGSLSPTIGYKAERAVVREIVEDAKMPVEWKDKAFYDKLVEELSNKIGEYPHHAVLRRSYYRMSMMMKLLEMVDEENKEAVNEFYQATEHRLLIAKFPGQTKGCHYCGSANNHSMPTKETDFEAFNTWIDGDNSYYANQLEIIHKMFMKNDDCEWRNNVIDFVREMSQIGRITLTLKDWHEFVDSDMFDPSLPASLCLSLAGNNAEEDEKEFLSEFK